MSKPMIGLPGRRKLAGHVAGMPAGVADMHVELHYRDYARCVAAAGGLPVYLPVDCDPDEIIEHLDGVVLTGGADIDPAHYGQDPHPDLGAIEPDRDAYELALLAAADRKGIPVLGICRGMQLINVARGGTLAQHVDDHAEWDLTPDTEIHPVAFTEGSCLAGLYGPSAPVNSLHHQVVDQVGEGLSITAVAPDGTIEALEEPGRAVVAVQWHPEMMGRNEPVFAWLVDAARAHAAAATV